MTVKKTRRALGRGLSNLIPVVNDNTGIETDVLEIDISSIAPNPFQPRRIFNDEDIKAIRIRDNAYVQIAKTIGEIPKSYEKLYTDALNLRINPSVFHNGDSDEIKKLNITQAFKHADEKSKERRLYWCGESILETSTKGRCRSHRCQLPFR